VLCWRRETATQSEDCTPSTMGMASPRRGAPCGVQCASGGLYLSKHRVNHKGVRADRSPLLADFMVDLAILEWMQCWQPCTWKLLLPFHQAFSFFVPKDSNSYHKVQGHCLGI
jgi:hypothetical protein